MKKYLISIFLIASFSGIIAQNSLSFYHLGNATFQNTFFNASVVPKGNVFVGLPALSGVHVNYNNKLSYNEIFTKTDSSQKVDLEKVLSKLQRENMLSFHTTINLLHIGFTAPQGATVYLFANERVEFDFVYPKTLIQFVAEGNAGLLEEKIKIGRTRVSATHFREMGVGYRYFIQDYNLGIGVRVKYFQGFFNASTPGNMKASLITERENYQLNIDMQDVAFRTSGRNIYENLEFGDHFVFNQNRGFGLDLGFTYEWNKYNTIAGAVNDIGYISWKEDLRNLELSDTTFRYVGVNLKSVRNLYEELEDSLINRFREPEETTTPYTTMVPPRVYVSWIYHLTPYNDIITTVGSRLVMGHVKVLAGVGINHRFGRFFVGSLNLTKLPQQLPNVGAAFAIRGGPAQFYLAADHIGNWSLPSFQAIDLRFGLNVLIRKNYQPVKTDGPRRARFLGSGVNAKGKDGIYTIIDKQRPRKKSSFMPKSNKNSQ